MKMTMRYVFVTGKSKMDHGFFSSELFSANDTKPAAYGYAPEKGPMSGAAYIDKRGREPGSGLTPDKKEARVPRRPRVRKRCPRSARRAWWRTCTAIVQHHRVIRAWPRVARA